MIEKILTVSSVGKLQKHAAVGDQTFRKLTVIYGDNAIGKTTLSAILDSLRENDPTTIVGRKTLGASEKQVVSILTSSGVRNFTGGKWDAAYPNLEVFNNDFVSRVVFSGDHVSNDHQKGLCSLLVGRTAVSEGARLESLRQELRAVNARIREVEAGIKPHIQGVGDVAEFSKLPKKDMVDDLLEVAKRKAAAGQDLATVLARPIPVRTDLPSPDEGALRSALERSIDSISADAFARIVAHREERMGGAGGPWLSEGMKYVRDQRCPFCDQSLSNSDFFPALKQYFSAAYEAYERELNEDLRALVGQFDPAAFESAVERLLRQCAIACTWDGRVAGIDVAALSTDLSAELSAATDACGVVRDALAGKQRDPLRAFDFDALAQQLRSLRESLAALQLVDAQVGAAKREIEAFVESVKGSDPESLKRQVIQLENQRTRHSEVVAPLCDEYLELVIKKEDVTGAGNAAKARMNQSMETLLAKYRDEMNGYLDHFGSAIRIENPHTNHQTKPPSIEYSISVNGVRVPLGKPAAIKDVPCFGNTLSDGEKNLFALSLFMAHVKSRTDLDQVVVVIDDPVNSLDQERRLLIADTLLSMLDELAQVVVLTHEPRLAHMLYRSESTAECKMLCIRREGSTSCLREWDTMDRDLATDYFRNYFSIADFVEGKPVSWEAVSRVLRPFLEDYLRQRFPGEFAVEEWLGAMADRIEAAPSDSPLALMKCKLADIRLVAKATNPRHHGSTHATGAEVLNATSTEIYAKKALSVVC